MVVPVLSIREMIYRPGDRPDDQSDYSQYEGPGRANQFRCSCSEFAKYLIHSESLLKTCADKTTKVSACQKENKLPAKVETTSAAIRTCELAAFICKPCERRLLFIRGLFIKSCFYKGFRKLEREY
jgi:hypothetical protein